MMSEVEFDSIDKQYVHFFRKFTEGSVNENEHFAGWRTTNPELPLHMYISKCFSDAFEFISKHADNELQFHQWKLEFDILFWKFQRNLQVVDANIHLRQIHIDQVSIARYTFQTPFIISIYSKECCSACQRNHGKQVSFESIFKLHLPYRQCINEEYCKCYYQLTPVEVYV